MAYSMEQFDQASVAVGIDSDLYANAAARAAVLRADKGGLAEVRPGMFLLSRDEIVKDQSSWDDQDKHIDLTKAPYWLIATDTRPTSVYSAEDNVLRQLFTDGPGADIQLYEAACEDNAPACRELLAGGVSINIHRRDRRDRQDDLLTPLHGAAQHGSVEVCRLLIASGADVNAKTSGGSTSLHYANSAEIAIELIEAGADLFAKDNFGYVPGSTTRPGVWIDGDVVDVIDKARRKMDLTGIAKRSRSDDLATPEQVLAKRDRYGRAM